jgi:hypothetical protein
MTFFNQIDFNTPNSSNTSVAHPRDILALRELVGDIRTEVLPALHNIFLEELQPLGPVLESNEQFISARQLPSNPVAVSLWEKHGCLEVVDC